MNARNSTIRKTTASFASAALLAALSFSAAAQSSAALADSMPAQATLMPTLNVTANASDPTAPQRWSISTAKPVRVTLLPALTIGEGTGSLAVTTLPTITVLANVEPAQASRSVFVSVAALPINDSFLLAE